MADIVTSLSSQTGIDGETVRKGLGALLAFLQKELSPDLFGKLQAALPVVPEMLSAYEPDQGGAGSGLLGMVSGFAGRLFGGNAGNGVHLLSDLSRVGLGAEQIEAFLPRAFDHLKENHPHVRQLGVSAIGPRGPSCGCVALGRVHRIFHMDRSVLDRPLLPACRGHADAAGFAPWPRQTADDGSGAEPIAAAGAGATAMDSPADT